jgi:hypothetical protein
LSDSLLIQPEGFLEEVVSEMNHERFGEEGEKHWREQKPERRSVRGSK